MKKFFSRLVKTDPPQPGSFDELGQYLANCSNSKTGHCVLRDFITNSHNSEIQQYYQELIRVHSTKKNSAYAIYEMIKLRLQIRESQDEKNEDKDQEDSILLDQVQRINNLKDDEIKPLFVKTLKTFYPKDYPEDNIESWYSWGKDIFEREDIQTMRKFLVGEATKDKAIIMAVTHIEYANPVLNHPELIKGIQDKFGSRAINKLIDFSIQFTSNEEDRELLESIINEENSINAVSILLGLEE
jgi:hypothetical protein